jgi:DHA1 family bicyclomycin/chloramphenicol resistance-like MFS transporter
MSAPLWLLTLITFSGTLAMHIFVPALPEAARDLGASVGAMQLTMSVYVFGLAVGQLAYGPLADRFGRRPVLIVGLLIYTTTGIWAFFASTVEMLIVVRLLQALGGCSGMVIGRAIVRDTSLPTESARRLAVMNLMVAVGPGVAPLLGGALSTGFGWRSIFVLLAGLGVVNLVFTLWLLRETRSDAAEAQASQLARNYVACCARPLSSASLWAAAAPRSRSTASSPPRPSSSLISSAGRTTRSASISPSWCPASGSARWPRRGSFRSSRSAASPCSRTS